MHIVCENLKARNEANVQRVQGTNHPDIYGQWPGCVTWCVQKCIEGKLVSADCKEHPAGILLYGHGNKKHPERHGALELICFAIVANHVMLNACLMYRREEFKVHSGKMSSVSRGV